MSCTRIRRGTLRWVVFYRSVQINLEGSCKRVTAFGKKMFLSKKLEEEEDKKKNITTYFLSNPGMSSIENLSNDDGNTEIVLAK